MNKILFIFFLLILFSCSNNGVNPSNQKNKNLKIKLNAENNLQLLKSKTWILDFEKDPVMGLNKVPESYYISRRFNDNGKGVESISTNTKERLPESYNFTYSLIGSKLKVTQDDGYVLNEELIEISENKLVLYITKFQNERTYRAKDKINKPILDE